MSLLFAPATASAQCPEWSDSFNAPGVDGPIYAMLRHDDGTGDALYVGGAFTSAGGVPAQNLARWDGTTWSALGEGPSGAVLALAFYDDGNGLALYAGGQNYYLGTPAFLERFDGTSWTSIPTIGGVEALEVHDDGNGAALYVGGTFVAIGGVTTSGIARYDGTWDDMGGGLGLGGRVRALASHDDGAGERLFVAGRFSSVSGVFADHIASWDGSTFAPLNSGITPGPYSVLDGGVWDLSTFDDGQVSGPGLYVCGDFSHAGGLVSPDGARWSSAGWQAFPVGPGGITKAMGVIDEVGGPVLYVASNGSLRKWDGTTLTPFQYGAETNPTALQAFDDGSGEALFLANATTSFGPVSPRNKNNFLRWDGASLSPVSAGQGIGLGSVGFVEALHSHDLGAGPALIAAGSFGTAGGELAALVASFDGGAWTPLGDNLSTWRLHALTSHDDGTGLALYTGGRDLKVDGFPAPVARFNGTNWDTLLPNIPYSGIGSGTAFGMATFREGSARNLFVGGTLRFTSGPSPVRYLARWDGDTWSSVGGFESGPGTVNVRTLVVHDDGSGPALYVAGNFEAAGGVVAPNIARWDGLSWTSVGSGLPGDGSAIYPVVSQIKVYNSPTGAVLVAAGTFTVADGAPANGVAQWDGATWSALGSGLGGATPSAIALASHDPDGNGELLYVMGPFETAGGLTVKGGATWNGSVWSNPIDITYTDPSRTGYVTAMMPFDHGAGRGLYIAGQFDAVDGAPSLSIARLDDPCGLDMGLPTCTSLPNSTGLRGRIRANGDASVAAADITLSARDLPPGAGTLLFHGPRALLAPFGDGLRCVGGALQRIYPIGQATGGTYELQLNFSAPYATSFVAGNTLMFQGWYRDGMGGPAGFNTTDALEVTFQP